MKIVKTLSAVAAVIGLLAGCSSEDLSPANGSIDQVIDVRTAAEFAQGHIAGAINIDVETADFDSSVSLLDKSKTYLVYCHSGRRSAIAAEHMTTAGMTVLDGGGLDSMLQRGWALGV